MSEGPRNVAAVALGSNLGDRRAHLERAVRALERTPGVVVLRRSRWHETAPVGGPAGQGAYLNGALLVETTIGPRELLAELTRLEARAGRQREVPHGPRTLDLDLLYFGDERCDAPDLTLPHPRMEERLFVLEPLAEIAPDHRLSGCALSVAERARELRARAAEVPR